MIAVPRVTAVLGCTNAAHQASARSFWMRCSGDPASSWACRCWWMCRSSRLSGSAWAISSARLARTALVTGMPDWLKRSCWP